MPKQCQYPNSAMTPTPTASTSPFWYGATVSSNQKAVYLYDHRDGNPDWKGAVKIDSGKVTRANVADFGTGAVGSFDPLQSATTLDQRVTHAIVHIDDPSTCYTADDTGLIVLWTSTQGSRNAQHQVLDNPVQIVQFAMHNGNAYRKSNNQWLAQFLKLNFNQAKTLVNFKTRTQASEFEKDFSHFLDIILPKRVDEPLALRLLCEAWILKNDIGDPLPEGVTLKAPRGLLEWLSPFRSGVDQLEANSVAALMGDFNDAAIKLFKAIDRSDGIGIAHEVRAFIDAKKATSISTEGNE